MTNFQCALIVASLLLIAGGGGNDKQKCFLRVIAAAIFVIAIGLVLN